MASRAIAVLTSGGDAPGMNAAIRAATRAAIDKGWDVFGVRDGYAGLVENRLEALGPRDVGGILGRGGTFLGSARLPEFREPSVQARALDNLRTRGIDGLIVIGGNGSQAGALALSNLGLEVVGVASTIDNDLAGSEITIGVDTALNIALEAIDRSAGHGLLAQARLLGRGDGAQLRLSRPHGGHRRRRGIGGDPGSRSRSGFDRARSRCRSRSRQGPRAGGGGRRGEVQRGGIGAALREEPRAARLRPARHHARARAEGGTPGAFDRLLATRFAYAAVEHLERGQHGRLIGLLRGEVRSSPLTEIVGAPKPLDLDLLRLQKVLAK